MYNVCFVCNIYIFISRQDISLVNGEFKARDFNEEILFIRYSTKRQKIFYTGNTEKIIYTGNLHSQYIKLIMVPTLIQNINYFNFGKNKFNIHLLIIFNAFFFFYYISFVKIRVSSSQCLVLNTLGKNMYLLSLFSSLVIIDAGVKGISVQEVIK